MRALRVALALALISALATPAFAPAGTGVTSAPMAFASRSTGVKADIREKAEAVKASIRAKAEAAKPTSKPKAPGMSGTTWVGGTIDGQWIVDLDSPGANSVTTGVKAIGGTVAKTSLKGDSVLVRLPSSKQKDMAGKIRALLNVKNVHQAVRFGVADYTPADPQYSAQWALDRVGMPSAWDVTTGTASVTIAVIDTGVDLEHPDLAPNLDTANDWDFVNDRPNAQDDHGHGTHVAGIAAAAANNRDGIGVAPGCTILPLKAIDRDGSGTDFDIAEAIKYAADKGVSVINMSIGGYTASQELVDAVQYAQARDVVVVAAAGNGGELVGPYPGWDYTGRVEYPGALEGVVGVGATTLQDTVVAWSSRGPEVDIAAPGVAILSTKLGGGMTTMSGTSMASPMVAGAIALVRSQHSDYTAEQAIEAVTSTAVDRGRPGRDLDYGTGRLNVAAALGAAGGTASGPSGPTADDVPGLALSTNTTTGTLDEDYDPVDVYAVHLEAGERLKATLTTPPKSYSDLLLFSPDTTSIYSYEPLRGYYDDEEEGPWSSPVSGSLSTVTFTAPREGDFYLAASGDGDYSITTTSTVLPATDNNLPGIPLPASPAKGSVDRKNAQDIYRIHLEEGQRFAARIKGGKVKSETEISATLYAPDIWDVSPWGEGSIDYTGWYGFPGAPSDLQEFMSDGMSYVAEKTGDYYFIVSNDYGPGTTYSLEWRIVEPEPDDDIPGVPIASSSQTGTLDSPFDIDDVYQVNLQKGDRLNLAIDSNPKGYFEVCVFGPDATDVMGYPIAVADRATTVDIKETGTYYLDVYAYFGGGPYRLGWSVQPSGSTEITASVDTTQPAFGKKMTIDTTVTSGGAPAIEQAVELQEWDFPGWYSVDATLTDTLGHVRFKSQRTDGGFFRVVTRNGWDYDAIGEAFAYKTGVSLTKPKASVSSIRRGKWVTWSGSVKPSHSWYETSVKLRFQKRVLSHGHWVWSTVKDVTVQPMTYYDETDFIYMEEEPIESKFASRVKLLTAGRYRALAVHSEDDEHLVGWSSAMYFSVK